MSIKLSIFDDLLKKKIIPDDSQKKLINIFDHFYSKEKKFFSKFFKKPNFLYIYGDVGRGKTFLMDIFYEHYIGKKNRIHYHNFMKKIHDDLKANQGIKDPIAHFCKTLKNQIDILFLDEFNITDITDAMIMQKILINLDKYKISLITTSNYLPDNLYKHGLQRERFLPSIQWIKDNFIIHQLNNDNDYRRTFLSSSNVFYFDEKEKVKENFHKIFNKLSHSSEKKTISIDNRNIAIEMESDNVVWFDFDEICGGFRSTRDYIKIAEIYSSVMISTVPCFFSNNDDIRRRFTWLIDALYDKNRKVIINYERELKEIFYDTENPEINRTLSRLIEMQSKKYLLN